MTAHPPVSRLDLERFVLGRLDAPARAALTLRIAQDPELEARVDRLRAELDAAAIDLPPLVLPTDDRPVLAVVSSPPRSTRHRWAVLGGGLAAAAGVALVLLPGGGPDERFRGSFELEVQHVRAGAATPVGLLVEARAGDTLQYTVTSATDGWWMVADIQDDGEVSMWTPPRRVQAGVPATAAVQLDGYTGSERAYFIVSEAPMELDRVRAAHAAARSPLAELDTLPGLPGTHRSVLVVRTVAP